MASIFKRTWYDAKGRERVGYRVTFSVNGVVKHKQFKLRRQAEKFRAGLSHYVASVSAGRLVSEVADDWIMRCSYGGTHSEALEPETVRLYAAYIRNHIKPNLGDRRIDSLTKSDVRSFSEGLLDTGVSRSTAKKILTAFKSILSYAVELGEIRTDPGYKVSIKITSRHRRQIVIPSKAEMRAVLDAAALLAVHRNKQIRKAWERNLLILEILVYCGLRLSELRGLRRVDISCEDRKITVVQRADRSGLIGPTKSAHGRRILYISDGLSDRLNAWLSTHSFDLAFPTKSGKPLSQENIRKRAWVPALAAAGIRKSYNLHTARHFFASRLIEAEVQGKELSVLMGHADPAFTLRVYGHLFVNKETQDRAKVRANALVLD